MCILAIACSYVIYNSAINLNVYWEMHAKHSLYCLIRLFLFKLKKFLRFAPSLNCHTIQEYRVIPCQIKRGCCIGSKLLKMAVFSLSNHFYRPLDGVCYVRINSLIRKTWQRSKMVLRSSRATYHLHIIMPGFTFRL